MLVLTRKIEEQIHIGDNITISILKLKGNTVRIGIEAPRNIRVLRGELLTFEIETAETGTSETATSNSVPAACESEQAEEEATVSEEHVGRNKFAQFRHRLEFIPELRGLVPAYAPPAVAASE